MLWNYKSEDKTQGVQCWNGAELYKVYKNANVMHVHITCSVYRQACSDSL